MLTIAVVDKNGKVRNLPIRMALEFNDEMDAQKEAAREWERHVERQKQNPFLDRLDRIHEFVKNAYADTRTVLKEQNLTDAEERVLFSIIEDLKKFEDEIREYSFKHDLKENY